MTLTKKAILVLFAISLVSVASAYSAESQDGKVNLKNLVNVGLGDETEKSTSYAPAQIIIKFNNDSVAGSVAHLLFSRGQSFKSIDEDCNLDLLNVHFGVKRIRKLLTHSSMKIEISGDTITPEEASRIHADSVDRFRSRFDINVVESELDDAGYLENAYVISFSDPKISVLEACREYEKDPSVKYASPNHIFEIDLEPPDPRYDEQWSHQMTNAEAGWDIETGDQNVTIAVIDTGVDYNHLDLAANIWLDGQGNPGIDNVDIDTAAWEANGYELFAEEDYTVVDTDPLDFHGHGTHCSGIAAAAAFNGEGGVGVAFDCRIMPVRAGFQIKNSYGQAVGKISETAVIDGIYYAVSNDAKVISMSFGLGGYNQSFQTALDLANSKDVVVLASAGNNNANPSSYYPATYDHVVAVAAVGYEGYKPLYSNYGFWIDVAAPGGNGSDGVAKKYMLSTVPTSGGVMSDPTGYRGANGTSMATPYAAGVAALLRSHFPQDSGDSISGRLIAGCDAIPGSFGQMSFLGSGIVNIQKALTLSERPYCLIRNVEFTAPDGTAKSVFLENETAHLILGIENVWDDATYVVAELYTSSPHVSIQNTFYNYGSMASGAQGDNAADPFVIQIGDVPIPGQGISIELGIRLHVESNLITRKAYLHVNREGIDFFDMQDDYIWYDLSGHRIGYSESVKDGAGHLYITSNCYDINTGKDEILSKDPGLIDLTYATYPAISCSKEVWESNLGHGGMLFQSDDIYYFDLVSEIEGVVCNDSGGQLYPEIGGSKVAWLQMEYIGEDLDLDVYLYDFITQQQIPVCVNPAGVQSNPSISGDRVVWMDTRNDVGDIYMLDLTTMQETAICTEPDGQMHPSFSGNKVVWRDHRDGSGDVYMYDLDTGLETAICSDPAEQIYPRIFNDRIVWVDGRFGNGDIFMYDLASQEEVQLTSGSIYESKGEVSATKISWIQDKLIYYLDFPNRNLGLIDGDDAVTVHDAQQIFDFLGDSTDFRDIQWENADINDDGFVSRHDADIISEYVAGNISVLSNKILIGDVDGDGEITVSDAYLVAYYYVGSITLEPLERIAGDANGDGLTNIVDALIILQYDDGVITKLPFPKK